MARTRVPEKKERVQKTARKSRGKHRTTAPGPERTLTAFRKQGKVVRERLTCSCCKSKRFQYWNIDPALAAILRHIETEWEADRESARGRSSREGGKKEREARKTRSGAIERGLRLSNSGAEWSWSNSEPDSVLNGATELSDRPAISLTHKTRTGFFFFTNRIGFSHSECESNVKAAAGLRYWLPRYRLITLCLILFSPCIFFLPPPFLNLFFK